MPKVWIATSAVDAITDEALTSFPRETGGVLLGYRGDGTDDVIVLEATGPGPGAEKTQSSFTPDQQYDVALVRQRFLDSHGRVTYLGDWHSHRDQPALLSRRDRRVLKRIGRHKPAQAAVPVMVIVGQLPDPTLAAWMWHETGRAFWFRWGTVRECDVRLFEEAEMSTQAS